MKAVPCVGEARGAAAAGAMGGGAHAAAAQAGSVLWKLEDMLPLLKPADELWKPAYMLPDAAALGMDGFNAACLQLRGRACRTRNWCASWRTWPRRSPSPLPTCALRAAAVERGTRVRDLVGRMRAAAAEGLMCKK